MKQGQYVLVNKLGQVVRTIHWENPTLSLVYREDNRRIESLASTQELEDNGIPFRVIANVSRKDVEASPVAVGDVGFLKFVPKVDRVVPSVPLKEDDPNRYHMYLKYSGAGHVGILAVLLILGHFFKPEVKEPEPPPVTVFMQQNPEKKPKQVVVAPAKNKVQPIKQKAKIANVTKKTQITKPVKKIANAKRVKKIVKSVHVESKRDIKQLGALGVLGGMNKNARGLGGLNLNNLNTRGSGKGNPGGGYSAGGNGGAGAGGVSNSLFGKGLVAAPFGSGAEGRGAGGYGTKGKGGGGSAGYGNMSMLGSSSGYINPMEEEATVEGGLDRDQILDVIARNMGQILYCYEKGLQTKPSLQGRVATKFVIGGAGRVSIADITHSSLRSGTVESCILGKLRGWKFPKPVGNVSVKVTYPFVLRRVAQQ